jgi:hypothetical protein
MLDDEIHRRIAKIAYSVKQHHCSHIEILAYLPSRSAITAIDGFCA